MNGYNYIDALNGTGAFRRRVADAKADRWPSNRYGMPNSFQTRPRDPVWQCVSCSKLATAG